MTDFDTPENREIVKAAEEAFAQRLKAAGQPLQAVYDAVAAKREKLRPKLLTAREAHKIWDRTPTSGYGESISAVLHEAHARVLKVIEALPTRIIDGAVRQEDADCRSMSDIRKALGEGGGS